MDLFSFPPEIRLKIYSELLVHDECIMLEAGNQYYFAPPLYTLNRPRLHPTILRTSKRVHSEAISALYSHNSFRFTDLYPTLKPPARAIKDPLVVFLKHIGPQAASLLRRVYTHFPTPPEAQDYQREQSALGRLRLDGLDLLLQRSPGITALELALPSRIKDLAIRNTPFFGETLDPIGERLGNFKSLQQVRIEVQLLKWESNRSDDWEEEEMVMEEEEEEEEEEGEEEGEVEEQEEEEEEQEEEQEEDEAAADSDNSSSSSGSGTAPWKLHRDSLVRQLRSHGWAVDVTIVPRVWISPDGGKFTDKAEYDGHMDKMWELEMMMFACEQRTFEAGIEYTHEREEYAHMMNGGSDDSDSE